MRVEHRGGEDRENIHSKGRTKGQTNRDKMKTEAGEDEDGNQEDDREQGTGKDMKAGSKMTKSGKRDTTGRELLTGMRDSSMTTTTLRPFCVKKCTRGSNLERCDAWEVCVAVRIRGVVPARTGPIAFDNGRSWGVPNWNVVPSERGPPTRYNAQRNIHV